MLSRSVRLICVPALLGLLLAVGFPLKSKTAGLFFPAGAFPEQASQKTAIPATPVTARPFQGSLPQSVKLPLQVARRNHTATALNNGRVLIVGGDNQDGAVGEAELLDPKTSTLVVAAKSLTARAKHAATLLANGKVLITGGSNQDGAMSSTEIFDPGLNAFTEGPRLQRARAGHSATLLGNGMVLIAGGQGEASAELYDPASNQSSLIRGKLVAQRNAHSAMLLADGRVLLAGGDAGNGHNLESAEVFNPLTQTFSVTAAPMLLGRARASLRVLPDGKVQVIGGDNDGTMEVYDPATGRFGALVHLAPTAELFSEAEMLGAKTRGGFVDAVNYRDKRIQRPASGEMNAAFGEFKRQQIGRSKYTVTEIPGANQAVLAGGVDDNRKLVSSVLLLPSSPASVSTDKVQYLPGEAPIISGAGWQAGETVTLIRQEANLGHERRTLRVVADKQGNFICRDLTAGDYQVWTAYTLTASGMASGQIAQTAYFDAPPPGKEKETLGVLRYQLPITNRDISIETETVTLKWTANAPASDPEQLGAAASSGSCMVSDGNLYDFSVDFSSVLNKPCFGISGNPCGAFGDVQIKEACLSASGSINVELCLLCPDGSGGFVDPYVRFEVQTDMRGRAVMAVDLNDDFVLPLFNIPTPAGVGTTAVPGLEALFSATLGLTVRGRVQATVTTPTSFETTMDFGQGSEFGVDSRLSPAFFNNTTTPSASGGDVMLTRIGEGSAKLSFGPNVGILVTGGPLTVLDFGVGVLGFVEPVITNAKNTAACNAATLDLYAGVEGDATARIFGGLSEIASFPFFRQQVSGFPREFAIRDTAPPAITDIPDIVQEINPATCNAQVFFNPTVTDDCSGVEPGSVTTSHASGSIFPIGETVVTVSAHDRAGNPVTASFKVTVTCSATMLRPSLVAPVAGNSYDQSVAVVTPANLYSYSLSGTLPSGLFFDPSIGHISGAARNTGTASFTITATGCGGRCSASQTYNLNITCPTITLTPEFLAQGTTGQPYDDVIYSSAIGLNMFSLVGGTLPPGLSLSADGRISGTPASGGTFSFTVKVNFSGCEKTQDFSLMIDCPPSLSLQDIPSPEAGLIYSAFVRSSATAAYTFTLTGGSLPPGITLQSDGHLVGVTNQLGMYTFTISASGMGCPLTRTYTLTVGCGSISIGGGTRFGTASVPFENSPVNTVPVFPNTALDAYTFTSSSLPPGLSLGPGGRITGTPTQRGTFTVTVMATVGGSACATSGTFTIQIGCVADFTFSPGSFDLPSGALGVNYNQTFSVTDPPGGGYQYEVNTVVGDLPPGLSLSTGGVLSGTPTATGTWQFTIVARGFIGPTGSCDRARRYRMTVTCPAITLSFLPDGRVNDTYNQTLAAMPAGGGYAFALMDGTLPDGLTLSGAVLSGTPTRGGTFTFTVRATATSFENCQGTRTYNLVILCPTITLSSLTGGVAGEAYSRTITASPAGGDYTFSRATALPPGLTLSSDGTLSGTPTQAGTFNFTVRAGGFGTCAKLQAYSLTFTCPIVTLSELPGGTAGLAYNHSLTTIPGSTGSVFSLTSGSLPPGLSLSSDGTLAGVPSQTGLFNFRITALAFGSCGGFRDYQLLVTCSSVTINPQALPGGTVGAAYDQTMTALPSGVYGYRVTSGALPTGLMLNAATGRITGAPTSGGEFTFTVQASASDCLGSRSYTINVGCAAMSITPASLAAATAGNTYSQSLSVSPAAPAGSHTFSLAQGNLPSGLTLHPQTGVISGLPSVAGTVSFIVKAQAANGCSTTQGYTLTINCPTVAVAPASLPNGATTMAYNQTFSAMPAGGNYSFSVTAGALPPGLSLNPATGALTGTPTQNGAFSFTITATGFGSCAGAQAYSITIGDGGCPTITLAELPGGQPGQLYNHSLAASPSGAYNYAVTAGSLPPGLTLYGSLGMLFGYPATAGSYSFTITATGANNCTGSKQYNVTIGGAALRSLTFGDFDGDGKADLSVWRGQAGDWLTVASGDGQLKTETWGTSAAPYFDVMTPGDYDGDGKMDLAVFRRSTGQWLIKGSRDSAVTAKVWGVATDIPVPGDYDGDGKTDLAVWRGAETNWYILRSSDGQTETISWGTSRAPYRDVPVAADFDGDGKTDIAIFRQQNGHWYIRLSSDGSVIDKVWGLGTDVPVAADYDGDGKADIAVWRGAETNWYVLRSSDEAVQTISWGTSSLGDVPVPGDYDGDGKADVAIWRGGDGNWYVKRSSDNATLTRTHGQAGDRPATAKFQW